MPVVRPATSMAHPRSRGENPYSCTLSTAPVGSSPLTRGKLSVTTLLGAMSGLIPAHAGKTPRALTDLQAVGGSSPLTRGKLGGCVVGHGGGGLIPAHAGKTRIGAWPHLLHWAHPRSRGENREAVLAIRRAAGSSPLTRGKRPWGWRRRTARRLIPAHAGKTERDRTMILLGAAHPRSRGENTVMGSARFATLGSSPLTRGKPVRRTVVPWVQRLIPAHAGKTFGVAAVGSVMPAHPRSRGENVR